MGEPAVFKSTHLIFQMVNQFQMRITVCVFLFFVIWVQGYAQSTVQLNLDHLTLEDGLSQSTGQAILQDSHGYMWFGTQSGLNKYNGYDITVYEHVPGNPASISSSHISYLFEDSRGDLWIGTTGSGLNLYDRERDQFIHFRSSHSDHHRGLNNNSITSIIEDADGNFWIGTVSGLNHFDRDKKEFIHFFADEYDPNSLSNSEISSLYLDSRGRLWIGTAGGLNYWDNVTGKFGHFKHDASDPNSISHNHVSVIHEDHSGNLWVGTLGAGINRFDPAEEKFQQYRHEEDDPYSISGNTILSILEDSRGVLWVGTENEGLNVFDRDNEQFYRHRSNVSNPHSLTHNSVYSLYENDDNILWIGTFSGGISYMDRKDSKFEHYKHNPFDAKPLNNNSVISFLETSWGSVLVGTDGGGLNVFDRETHEFTQYKHSSDDPASLPSNVVLALHEDRQGSVWIGFYNGGITRYDPGSESITHYRHDPEDPHSLRNDHVFAIHEGRDGEMWFGTNGGGVNLLDPESGRFERIAAGNDAVSVIRALYEDSHGSLWVAMYGSGLAEIDKKGGTVINHYVEWADDEWSEGLASNVILAIHEDKKENLWLGTVAGGLHFFDRKKKRFTAYSVDAGLPGSNVYGILEDDNGSLWLSTGAGLAMFDPETEAVSTFNVEHGIQSSEFNPLAYYRDREGYMYFGGINGFNRFHPNRVTAEEAVPPVVLTDLKVFNQAVEIGEDSPLKKHISLTDQIILPHSANVLTFDYVALNFNKNKGNQFAYMLEGFDSGWNYVGPRRSATYTNLNPGQYTFRVKAANIYGVWGETDQTLAVTIMPPFWQTSWFRVLVILGFLGTLLGGIQWRLQSIRRQNRELEKKVARHTIDLVGKNKELSSTLDELKQARSELVDKAHKAGMADLAANVLHNVGNILNSVNVSVAMIDDKLKRSKLLNLKQASRLLEKHAGDLENFILNDRRGKKLLNYFIKLEEPFSKEHEELGKQAARLTENMKLMIDVVSAQQSYSNAGRIIEYFALEDLVQDTLVLQAATIERHGLNLVTDYQPVEEVQVEKSKIIHILVNLFKNAKESMSDLDPGKRMISLKTFQDDDYVYLSIIDIGCGIPKEDLKKIFNHGYTTKSYGHGFGLHSCANYMNELGGGIRVESEGHGKGTSVTLSFPRKENEPKKRMKARPAAEFADIEMG